MIKCIPTVLVLVLTAADAWGFTPVCNRDLGVKKALERAYKKNCDELTQEYLKSKRIVSIRIHNDSELKKISDGAFEGVHFVDPYPNKFPNAITIHHNKNLTAIESGAFRGIKGRLNYLQFRGNSSLEIIERRAFKDLKFLIYQPTSLVKNRSLLQIYDSSKLRIIEPGAFQNVDVDNLVISKNPSLVKISSGTFAGFRHPEKVSGKYHRKTNLSLNGNLSLQTLEPGAFRDTNVRIRISSNPALEKISAETFEGNESKFLYIIDNEKLSLIEPDAFKGSRLFYVSISENPSLKRILSGTFSGTDLYRIELSKNQKLEIIEPGAFSGTMTVADIIITYNPSLKRLYEGTFEGTETSLSIANNVRLEVIEPGVLFDTLTSLHVSSDVLGIIPSGELMDVTLNHLTIETGELPLKQEVFSVLGLKSAKVLKIISPWGKVSIPSQSFTPHYLGLTGGPLAILIICYDEKSSYVEGGAFDTVKNLIICGQEQL